MIKELVTVFVQFAYGKLFLALRWLSVVSEDA